MTIHSHAVVWTDHREARVLHFNEADVACTVVRPGDPNVHLHHKANTVGSGRAPIDRDFHRRVAQAIGDKCLVLVTGPSTAKEELAKTLASEFPAMKGRVAGVEPLDHPTDGELVAHARAFFRRYHNLHPASTARSS